MTPGERWEALKADLEDRQQHQRKVCDRLLRADSDSIAAMAAAQCIYETYKSMLAKMRELEADR